MPQLFRVVYLVIIFAIYTNANEFKWPQEDKGSDKWINNARHNIHRLVNRKLNGNIAKNIILFLGDGMGISTITAGRIRKGQKNNRSGEEEITYMESLDHVALSKTYNIDAQIPDSAGTATAFLCGVKTGVSIIGLNGNAELKNCKSTMNSKIDSILKWAHKAGKRTGIVTTTRVTHATPAAAYAHSASRNWESYNGVDFTTKEKLEGCSDIASQLIDNNAFINVVFGGGRKSFLPRTTRDYENATKFGDRIDGRHLINEWERNMEDANKTHKFIWNLQDLRNLDSRKYEHVLGLFGHDHLSYVTDRNTQKEPSLIEMTEKAIQILENSDKKNKGFFLLVEGGRIDHGHHESKGKKALEEFVEFDNSVGTALHMTSEVDTLIVVTADHSHTLSVGGYAKRGGDIFGLTIGYQTPNSGNSNYTFSTLLYGNGPGGIRKIRTRNLTIDETSRSDYVQESAVFLKMETHGAEDVAIFSRGPMSHLFDGTVEQSYIPHAMAYSACIGPIYENDDYCKTQRGVVNVIVVANSAISLKIGLILIYALIFTIFNF